MNYWSRIHAFARDYILEHGTDATDFQVKMAVTEWGTDMIRTPTALHCAG